jgi:hypothetical protein
MLVVAELAMRIIACFARCLAGRRPLIISHDDIACRSVAVEQYVVAKTRIS